MDKLDLSLFDIPIVTLTAGSELAALSNHIRSLETHEKAVKEIIIEQRDKQLALLKDPEQYEVQEIFQIEDFACDEVPRIIYNPVVVSLWGTVESIIDLCCKFIEKENNLLFSFNELNGKSLVSKSEKYLNYYANLNVDYSDQSKLEDIRKLRNLIAHTNGNLSNLTETRKDNLNKLIHRIQNIDISNDIIYVSNTAIQSMHVVVHKFLSSMVDQVSERYSEKNLLKSVSTK